MEFKYSLIETLEARFDDVDEMRDIRSHGIMGGFNGFIYTHEINEFFNEFENEIEDYFWGIYGDDWLETITQNCTSMDEVRANMVWAVAEDYCENKLEDMEEDE